MSQSKWSGLIYNTEENNDKFDSMIKDIDEEYRITQTESKLRRDNVDTEKRACDTHNKIGRIVRNAIKHAGRDYARKITYAAKKSETNRKRDQ